MSRHYHCFGNSLYAWILLNRIIGFWPYFRSADRFVKYKYHLLITMLCLSAFILQSYSFDMLLQRQVEGTRYYGGFAFVNNALVALWVLLSALNNDALLHLFHLFDKFDSLLKSRTSKYLTFKKFYQFRLTKILLLVFGVEFFLFTVMLQFATRKITNAVALSVLRLTSRLGHFCFVILYCHILESLRLRLVILKSVWLKLVTTKIHRRFLHSHISAKMNEIILLHYDLQNIVNNINTCLGSRLVLLYTMMCYQSCLYFYLICNDKKFVNIIFLGYPLIIVTLVTLLTQDTISSTDFITQLVSLPVSTQPNELLLQIYHFLRQLRKYPVYISAAGFFYVDGKLLSSIFMALASYLVAIFQLSPVIQQIGTTIEPTI